MNQALCCTYGIFINENQFTPWKICVYHDLCYAFQMRLKIYILQQNKICVKIGREKYAIYNYYDYMKKHYPMMARLVIKTECEFELPSHVFLKFRHLVKILQQNTGPWEMKSGRSQKLSAIY